MRQVVDKKDFLDRSKLIFDWQLA